MGKSTECVRVVVRCRPMSEKETNENFQRVVDVDSSLGKITLHNTKTDRRSVPPKVFTFDSVYDWDSQQKVIYDESARHIVQSVMDGYNGTIFAYGQTGAGKTFTMSGKSDNDELRGIIPNTFEHIFSIIQDSKEKQFLVRSSFLEIYNEDIRDLMSKDMNKNLELKEASDKGVYVKDLTPYICKNVSEIEHIMKIGNKNRHTGETKMNLESSRSHSIFTIVIESSELDSDGEQHIRVGKLNLVDLAGSERVSKTGATGHRLIEGAKINLSLCALGNVISALVDGKSTHIPYRDSKLTRLLQDSLGGNTKTVMIANIGPADYNYEETLSTLRYANRAKNIQNKPTINEDPKDAMIREFQEEIHRLRDLLDRQKTGGDGTQIITVEGAVGGLTDEQLEQLRRENEEERSKLQEERTMAEEEKRRAITELEQRHSELDRERAERENLSNKLTSLEQTLMHGGENLLEKAKAQEQKIRSQQAELENREREESRVRAALAEKEEALLDAEDKFYSLEEEVDVKTKKLRKLFKRLQSSQQENVEARQEIDDLQQEFQQEREDMLDTIREYEKQLMQKMLIIDNFIPAEEVLKIERRAVWNEEKMEWTVQKLQFAGNNTAVRRPGSALGGGMRKPVSGHRYTGGDNILSLNLDMPERTTVEYSTVLNSRYLLAGEARGGSSSEEIDSADMFHANENAPHVYLSYGSGTSASTTSSGVARPPKRPATGRSRKKTPRSENYPEARGLVPGQAREV